MRLKCRDEAKVLILFPEVANSFPISSKAIIFRPLLTSALI